MDEKITIKWLKQNASFREDHSPYHFGFMLNPHKHEDIVRILFISFDICDSELNIPFTVFLSQITNYKQHDQKEQTFKLDSFTYIHEIQTLLKLIK